MNFDEIRTVKRLIEIARDILRVEPDWAIDNFTAFEMVMRRHRPREKECDVTDRQFTQCLHLAWLEVKQCRK